MTDAVVVYYGCQLYSSATILYRVVIMGKVLSTCKNRLIYTSLYCIVQYITVQSGSISYHYTSDLCFSWYKECLLIHDSNFFTIIHGLIVSKRIRLEILMIFI